VRRAKREKADNTETFEIRIDKMNVYSGFKIPLSDSEVDVAGDVRPIRQKLSGSSGKLSDRIQDESGTFFL
jgi:hypothetical protein